jgi:hypothetical protein
VDAPPVVWEPFPPLQVLATHTGALALTGPFADADGLELELLPVPASVVALAPPEPCELVPPSHLLATHTGALALTGVLAEAEGSTCVEPFVSTSAVTDGWPPAVLTCTVATGWFRVPFDDDPLVALEPPVDCEALPPFEVDATVTGALAFTGAFAEGDGLTVDVPAWLWPVELELEGVVCEAEVPLLVLATVTGAFTLAGAFAAADGPADGALTCAVPAVLTAAWAVGALTAALAMSDGWAGLPGCPSAGAAHPSATTAAPRAIRRFMIVPLFLAVRTFQGRCRTSRQRKTGRKALAGTFEQEAQGRRPVQVRVAPEPSVPAGGRQQEESERNRKESRGCARSGRACGHVLVLRQPRVGRRRGRRRIHAAGGLRQANPPRGGCFARANWGERIGGGPCRRIRGRHGRTRG